MECIVLTLTEHVGQQWQYGIENLGAEWRCTTATGVEQALLRLADWTDVLILLPCRESRILVQALQDVPLLSPPYILGAGMAGQDGSITDAALLPEIVSAWRQTGTLPVLSLRHLPATMEIAAALLRTMEVPRRLRAWDFLPEMTALTVVHPPLLTDLRHGLYPLIARRHGMTAAGVERSLRLCVESTWTHGNLGAMERFFGSSVDPERGKPTNREFLCRVQERLTLSMRKLI